VVATPIGNLDDVSVRALRVLASVDLIAAEDTRRTLTLLRHHGISRPLTSYYDAVERERAPRIVEKLRQGARVALVSDAGTPGVADPGYHLVRGAVAAGVPVVPIPGPSSAVALVSVAGLPAERFVFEGFLPTRRGPRRQRLEALATETRALVFLEAARRLVDFLGLAVDVLGDREAVVGRELTKLHEELLRGRLRGLRDVVAAREPLKGEVTVLIAGASEAAATAEPDDLDAAIRAALAAGQGTRELSAEIARRTGRARRDVYRRALAIKAISGGGSQPEDVGED
jgi:16S rRNA (cytidine1402-2'-O)-methyltransferase